MEKNSGGPGVDLSTRLDTHVLVHHVAAVVRVAHPQRDLAIVDLWQARLRLGQPVVCREALEARADAPCAEGGRGREAEIVDRVLLTRRGFVHLSFPLCVACGAGRYAALRMGAVINGTCAAGREALRALTGWPFAKNFPSRSWKRLLSPPP